MLLVGTTKVTQLLTSKRLVDLASRLLDALRTQGKVGGKSCDAGMLLCLGLTSAHPHVLQDILYDIATQAAMEFRVDDVWAAIPLISDTRLLLFNATTLTKLGLDFPPPHGLWNDSAYGDSNVCTPSVLPKLHTPVNAKPPRASQRWTWDALANHSITITKSGIGYGFQLDPNYDVCVRLLTVYAMVLIAHALFIVLAGGNEDPDHDGAGRGGSPVRTRIR